MSEHRFMIAARDRLLADRDLDLLGNPADSGSRSLGFVEAEPLS
ncbi:MAG: hypothetical protein QM675_10570 [Protaetiibacter sp.]